MLFNSYVFLFVFFPIVLVGFFSIARLSHAAAATWLALASLFFYGYWSVAALPLLVTSICVNYWFGLQVSPAEGVADERRKLMLKLAVGLNLVVLGIFKYANFFIDNVDLVLRGLSQREIATLAITLPIGISFFTFTQIAFLVDCFERKVRERNFIHYVLFVSYFPHLISGPVLHHGQMMPQFRKAETYRPIEANMTVGLLFIVIGLAKKVLLADEFSQYASPIFDAVHAGAQPGCLAAWTAALAYTLQIYFDFSGYTDMAIGLSRMFGIRMPLNFDSPYKATSIIEFWRRWHMSLSQFLRDYLYIRLGGNRYGVARRYMNLLLTMLIGGLWHGANWTFVVWGGLHGCYLLINHAWRAATGATPGAPSGARPVAKVATLATTNVAAAGPPSAAAPAAEIIYSTPATTVIHPAPATAGAWVGRAAGSVLTFLLVVVAWVFFRAVNFQDAIAVLRGMAGAAGVTGITGITHLGSLPQAGALQWNEVFRGFALPPVSFGYLGTLLSLGFALVWLFPNSQAIAERAAAYRGRPAWLSIGLFLFAITGLAAINASRHVSEFIYFNF